MGNLLAIFAKLPSLFGLGLSFLSGPFGIVWGLVSSLWSTEFGRLLIVGASAFLVARTLGWSHEYHVKVAALAARDSAWEQKIAQANAQADFRINAALEAAKQVKPAPESKSDLLALCEAETSCRKALKSKK